MAFATPEEAALSTMPEGITHVVFSPPDWRGDEHYVLLAVEVAGTGYYLDENICYRDGEGWWPGDSAGGGFTDRTLQDLRANPPRRGM